VRFFGWFRRKAADEQPVEEPAPRRWAWLGGRRVYNDQFYFLPKDEKEGHRLDFQHYMICLAMGHYRAPVRAPRTILDVACGTGIWSRDMAKKFPRAQLIGFDRDRTPLEASLKRLGDAGVFPPNFKFLEANALERFPFEDGYFDFTFARFISGFVPKEQWPALLREMARVTRRGGYLEVLDFDVPVSESQSTNYLAGLMVRMTEQSGRHFGAGPYLEQYFKAAGLERVQVRHVDVGTGRYAEREQTYMRGNYLEGLTNVKPLVLRTGLATEADYSVAFARAEEELPHSLSRFPLYSAFSLKL
jgi:ubiquinone/menaquinone biosynthesis C-methylase UbiE